jgi:hypothetical protein
MWRFPDGRGGDRYALSGGLPQGAITEVTSACGGGLLLVSLLQQVEQARAFVALIDGRDSFDPATVRKCALRRLLWVRCHSAELAVKAADLLLAMGICRSQCWIYDRIPAKSCVGFPPPPGIGSSA